MGDSVMGTDGFSKQLTPSSATTSMIHGGNSYNNKSMMNNSNQVRQVKGKAIKGFNFNPVKTPIIKQGENEISANDHVEAELSNSINEVDKATQNVIVFI